MSALVSRSQSPPSARWILSAVVLGSGIVFLDGTIVNVALKKIGEELPATLVGAFEGQAYITSGYLAVLAALLILAGALADRYGRRRIFAIGLAGFGVTSALCGLAPSMELMIVFRLLQGAAGALLVPGSLSLITANFEGEARGRAFGIWAASTSALTVLGPLVGGVLVDSLSWRIAFLVNVPLVIIALYATMRHVPESRDESARRLDWLGSFVIALAIGGISFGLVRGQERQWNDALAFGALGIGIVAAVVFPIMMLRRSDPLIPPDLFRRRNFTVINISTFLIYGALYVTLTVQSLFMQGVLGYTALGASAIGLPVGIFLSLGSTRVGTLAGRLGPRRFLIIGPLLMAAAMLWYVRTPATSRPWQIDLGNSATYLPPSDVFIDIVPAILLFGVGITLVVAPLTTALMNSIPVRNAGLGSAINNAVSRVGQPLIMAILFIAISATFYSSISGRVGLDTSSQEVRQQVQPLNPPKVQLPPDQQAAVTQASTDAFHLAMLVNVALLVAGAGANAVGLRRGAAAGAADEAASGAPSGEAAEGVPSAG
jgi:EmrB/QacA subfamily drug resistance transporter